MPSNRRNVLASTVDIAPPLEAGVLIRNSDDVFRYDTDFNLVRTYTGLSCGVENTGSKPSVIQSSYDQSFFICNGADGAVVIDTLTGEELWFDAAYGNTGGCAISRSDDFIYAANNSSLIEVDTSDWTTSTTVSHGCSIYAGVAIGSVAAGEYVGVSGYVSKTRTFTRDPLTVRSAVFAPSDIYIPNEMIWSYNTGDIYQVATNGTSTSTPYNMKKVAASGTTLSNSATNATTAQYYKIARSEDADVIFALRKDVSTRSGAIERHNNGLTSFTSSSDASFPNFTDYARTMSINDDGSEGFFVGQKDVYTFNPSTLAYIAQPVTVAGTDTYCYSSCYIP